MVVGIRSHELGRRVLKKGSGILQLVILLLIRTSRMHRYPPIAAFDLPCIEWLHSGVTPRSLGNEVRGV